MEARGLARDGRHDEALALLDEAEEKGASLLLEERLETALVRAAVLSLAGRFSEMLYTLGIVGVGLLAIPTLAGSSAYAFAETFGWRRGLDHRLRGARYFYGVIVLSTGLGVALDFLNVNPVRALYWTAVVNGLLAPFILAAILVFACSRRSMRGAPIPWLTRIAVGAATALLFAAAAAMFLV